MYKFNRITDSSYSQIQRLYKESFGSDHPISSIRRKYDTSIFGLKNTGILAVDDDNSPAAYYGVFPIVLQYDSKDYIVAQSGDTMTSPNHRKKGLFVKLAKETYQLSKQVGIKLIFGFPNKNSYPGFKKKLDWVFNGNMKRFTINNFTIPLCELASKYKFVEKYYTMFVDYRISRYVIKPTSNNIQCFSASEAIGRIKKDESFFNYKMKRGECLLIRINNFTLFIKPKTHLFIGDIGYFDKKKTKELINTVKKLSRILGCKKAIFSLSNNHWLYEYLIDKIKPTESLPIGYYLFDNDINITDIQFVHADYDTF